MKIFILVFLIELHFSMEISTSFQATFAALKCVFLCRRIRFTTQIVSVLVIAE